MHVSINYVCKHSTQIGKESYDLDILRKSFKTCIHAIKFTYPLKSRLKQTRTRSSKSTLTWSKYLKGIFHF